MDVYSVFGSRAVDDSLSIISNPHYFFFFLGGNCMTCYIRNISFTMSSESLIYHGLT